MSGTSFAFTYAGSDGSEGEITLDAMRKMWVDSGCSGIVFAEPAPDGSEVLHEVVIEGSDAADGMTDIMVTLIGAQSFERLEAPLPSGGRLPLILEFRSPNPHIVALAYRA